MFHFHVHKAAIEPHSRRNWFIFINTLLPIQDSFCSTVFLSMPNGLSELLWSRWEVFFDGLSKLTCWNSCFNHHLGCISLGLLIRVSCFWEATPLPGRSQHTPCLGVLSLSCILPCRVPPSLLKRWCCMSQYQGLVHQCSSFNRNQTHDAPNPNTTSFWWWAYSDHAASAGCTWPGPMG